jgi:hypothetical protein
VALPSTLRTTADTSQQTEQRSVFHQVLHGLEKSISTWGPLPSLEQVVEVVQALAQLPDGDPDAQLPGQLQPHL